MPEADVLIHTGDFINEGSSEHFSDFNAWLGELSERYPYRIVIAGNHEYKGMSLDPQLMKEMLPNAIVLEHEEVDILGLRIFGSPWIPGHRSQTPGDGRGVTHRFAEIPVGLDILLTHCSPFGIMDCCELKTLQWGGSKALLQEILRTRPRVHLFGHLHEQRGLWYRRIGSEFQGGIDYELPNGVHPTWGPPPADYPCELICCNAMKNHGKIDSQVGNARKDCIAGPARLIVAKRTVTADSVWSFHVPNTLIAEDAE